jgi:hypothetical protein
MLLENAGREHTLEKVRALICRIAGNGPVCPAYLPFVSELSPRVACCIRSRLLTEHQPLPSLPFCITANYLDDEARSTHWRLYSDFA